jgi:hypothetical protein
MSGLAMSISATDKIDLVSKKKTGEYVLVIVADEPWRDTDDFRYQLQAKLNSYCSYFLDGQMKKQYPDLDQKRITVSISSTVPIPPESKDFIRKATLAFKLTGLNIESEELS